MNKTVKLYNSTGRLTNREPFILQPYENFTLDLDCDVIINDAIVIYKKDGVKKEVHYQQQDLQHIDIPREFCQVGTVEIELDILSHGLVVRRHYLDPITFCAVDEGYKGHLEFDELLKKVDFLEKQLEAQNQIIQGFEARLDISERKVNEIWANEEM